MSDTPSGSSHHLQSTSLQRVIHLTEQQQPIRTREETEWESCISSTERARAVKSRNMHERNRLDLVHSTLDKQLERELRKLSQEKAEFRDVLDHLQANQEIRSGVPLSHSRLSRGISPTANLSFSSTTLREVPTRSSRSTPDLRSIVNTTATPLSSRTIISATAAGSNKKGSATKKPTSGASIIARIKTACGEIKK